LDFVVGAVAVVLFASRAMLIGGETSGDVTEDVRDRLPKGAPV
jgi:hypothetical protein